MSLTIIGLFLGSFTQGVIPITHEGGEVSPSVDKVMPMQGRPLLNLISLVTRTSASQ